MIETCLVFLKMLSFFLNVFLFCLFYVLLLNTELSTRLSTTLIFRFSSTFVLPLPFHLAFSYLNGVHSLMLTGVIQEFSRVKNSFPGLNTQFSLGQTITNNICHSRSKWNWVFIKYKKYNPESDASAGFACFVTKTDWKKFSKLMKFSRNTGKWSVFLRVYQGPGRKFQKF